MQCGRSVRCELGRLRASCDAGSPRTVLHIKLRTKHHKAVIIRKLGALQPLLNYVQGFRCTGNICLLHAMHEPTSEGVCCSRRRCPSNRKRTDCIDTPWRLQKAFISLSRRKAAYMSVQYRLIILGGAATGKLCTSAMALSSCT